MSSKSRTPAGLGASGKRLWHDITGSYEVNVSEELVLLQAARCADRLDQLHREQADQPSVTTNRHGEEVTASRIIEARQQSLTLARLVASLRLPDEHDQRPQRRGGVRGTYPKAVG